MAGVDAMSCKQFGSQTLLAHVVRMLLTTYMTAAPCKVGMAPCNSYRALGNFDAFSPFDVKRSAGFGVRIMLPMFGVMGLDYGWGFDDVLGNPDANGGQFHFSIGQQF